MDFLMNTTLWVGITIFFGLCVIGLSIFYYILFKKSHLKSELKCLFSKSPMAMFFQDNKFSEWRPVSIINGIVYDKYYGPFIVSTTYVDKKTKNIVIPFDVDLDGSRKANVKDLVAKFKHVTNNQKNIGELRAAISNGELDESDDDVTKLTSELKYSNLKNLFVSSVPHNIKSKIEKIVSERVSKPSNVNPMQAIIVFGAIFGIIVFAALILKSTGGF